MAENINKVPPKGKIKFNLSLSDEQKLAKTAILYHPYNFIQVMSENLNEAINHNYLDYPVCKAPSQQYWDNCFGVQSYNDDEDYYIGTFSNGKRSRMENKFYDHRKW